MGIIYLNNMSALPVNSFQKEDEPSFTPVMIYGIVADLLIVVPIILYMVLRDVKNNFNQFHSTMINMLTSAWMPFAISWIIALAADGPMARAGLTSFIMAAHNAQKLGSW